MDIVENYKIKVSLKKDYYIIILLLRASLCILTYVVHPKCIIMCTCKQGDMMHRYCFYGLLVLLHGTREHCSCSYTQQDLIILFFFSFFSPKPPSTFQLSVLLVVACGMPPQHGLMSGAMSEPRIQTGETLGQQSRTR